MEAFALWLFKSVVWITGFTLVFFLFLRNERFFILNRIFLLTGILTAFIFPFISVHYTVELLAVRGYQIDGAVAVAAQQAEESKPPFIKMASLVLYFSGLLFVFIRLIRQTVLVLKTIRSAETVSIQPVILLKTTESTPAFSFFSRVFVNPSVTDLEVREIVNHELVHIRQRHWFDLVLTELLCMLQWFNPLVWIYGRLIRQNHEYLADEGALQRSSDPAVYKATLLNQIVGAPIVSLANSFNYSVNKKRFYMMKNLITSPYRKLKILFILPVFAIVLYSFAEPDYKYIINDENSEIIEPVLISQVKEVKGTVVQETGKKPLAGATIVVRGTTQGTVADDKGTFTLTGVPDDGMLVVSYVGYKLKVIRPDFSAAMTIQMVRDTVKVHSSNISAPPPPPPPPHGSKFTVRTVSGIPPLYVLNGEVLSASEAALVNPETIESISVLKDKSATTLYGEKGKDGVIIITSKKRIEGLPMNYDLTTINKDPLYVINGKIASKHEADALNPMEISSVNVIKGQPSIDKYGDKAKDGVIEITVKKPGSPLIIIEGVESKAGANDIDPDNIESMTVLKDETAVARYGEKGKNGVIEIKTKNNPVVVEGYPIEVKEGGGKTIVVEGYPIDVKSAGSADAIASSNDKRSGMDEIVVVGYASNQKKENDQYVVTEEMPAFPGGHDAMKAWIISNLKYPAGAVKEGITGKVDVIFTVTSEGKVKNVKASKSIHPFLDTEAVRLIKNMPNWKPGSQAGRKVDVRMMVPVDFKLN
jgi:TonB family protein